MANLSYQDVKDITKIIKKFQVIEGNVTKVSIFSGGRINETYKVTIKNDKEEKIYLLQRVNHTVFKDIDGLMNNVNLVTTHIKNKGKQTINFIRTADNKFTISSQGVINKWRCYEFIGADVYDCINKSEDMENLGIAVADFCKDLNDFDAHGLIETIPDFHNTRKRFETFLISVIKAPEERRKLAKKEIEQIINQKNIYSIIIERLEKGIIPLRVTHNDPKLNNVLFDKQTGMPKCMIDLDTVMPGSILYDIGDAIRYGANTASEEETDLEKVHFDIKLYEEFIKGYLSIMGEHVTNEEYEIMHFAPLIMTYELAIRFLTDYLDGNKYFSVSYPTQNLDRAKVQLRLAIYMPLCDMKDIIQIYRKFE